MALVLTFAITAASACAPDKEEAGVKQIRQEEEAAAYVQEIQSEFRFEFLACAENYAMNLSYGDDEYYAVPIEDLERNCP